jgi:alkylation response protein AidB-like acyl-CoA dehydrogenase
VDQLLATSPSEESWPALVDFGALAIAPSGGGLGAVELALIGRALGATLASVPFIDTAAARYATRAAEHPAAATLRAGGDAVSLCLLEPGSGWELTRLATHATRADKSLLVEGRKVAVHHPMAAAKLLVLYTDTTEQRRIGLIGRSPAGLEVISTTSIDPSLPTADILLSAVEMPDPQALPPGLSEAVLARLLAIGSVLAASEAVGAAGTLLELARDYASERRQFGRPIGSFQALRHLLADMHVKQASAWSSVLFAAAALEEGLQDARRTASIAKAYASRATLEVAHGAIQVFGGIAFTAEHSAHSYLRRILVRGNEFGDARHHERMLGRELVATNRREELVV